MFNHLCIKENKIKQPTNITDLWIFRLIALMLLLAALPVQAKDYLFPGTLPFGCSGPYTGGAYHCGGLILNTDDTITTPVSPTTISFSGAFVTGDGVKINGGGSAANLTLVLADIFIVGDKSNINANVIATAAITVRTGSMIGGSITSTTPTGNITTADSSIIVGLVDVSQGAVTIGANSVLHSTIIAKEGVVTIGDNSQIKGDIVGGLGAITTGIGVTVGSLTSPGNMSTTTGVVTIGAGNKVGAITTTAGAITIGDASVTGAIASSAGVIVIRKEVTVIGNIGSGAGAVSMVCQGHVLGDVIIIGAGTVTMAAVLVEGDITGSDAAIVLTDSFVVGSVGSTGGAIITLTNTQVHATKATMAQLPACLSSTPASLFDCLETGASLSTIAPNHLYTKLAASPFTLDIAALKIDKTLESNYVSVGVGATPKYTRVELFDDTTPPSSCANYTNPVAAQTVIFTSSNAGRLTDNINLEQGAYQKLRCRVTECTDSTCKSFTGLQSCSSDQFSVRPVEVTLTTTANALAPSATALPMVKTGNKFNLSASLIDSGGGGVPHSVLYSGALTLDKSKLAAQNPTQDTRQSGGEVGVLTPATLTTNAASSNVTYSEAGYLYLAAEAYVDNTFTLVDSVNGDCLVDSLSTNVSVDGQYGCRIGSTELSLGRFIPDHFDVSVNDHGKLAATCLSGDSGDSGDFTYTGQAMGYVEGSLPSLTIKPMNTVGAVTKNYQSHFKKLNETGVTIRPPTEDTAELGKDKVTKTVLTVMPVSTASAVLVNEDGTMTYTVKADQFTYTRDANALVAPYTTQIPLEVSGVRDGEVSHSSNLPILEPVGVSLRFGRLNLTNASGSQLQALPVPVEAQYWNGSSFVINAEDSCTPLANTSIMSGNYQGALSTIAAPSFRTADANGNCAADSPLNSTINQGKSCILVDKPSVAGSFDMLVNLGSAGSPANCLSLALASGTSTLGYLSGNWCGTNYDRDPVAHVTFGIYKNTNKGKPGVIYIHEIY